MIKRFLSLVIIFSMILHCSSRLGVISFLYKNRFDIAESLGLTQEKHITSCDSHYYSRIDLKIENADSKAELPMNLAQALEINLFHFSGFLFTPSTQLGESITANFPSPSDLLASYSKIIFHPPLS